ncbi:uncharacterized protein BO80DRAFT_345635 [Aspergillus ibericus CBS 121593]|uniref:Uncharacterized protein n=1 Tax=Aspergillus ibericus CBS 121593 TaxID=1448316 RepID=A0A395HC95_9EURO|nr:hypothetical protein BO80DRAFT_345635 [Aspergillus ibericus CBS 121593]RAL05330.1 hypothetical protein BO80DRAFT_345635 [Aspergillus ibericus CBS 121593]
MKLKLKRLTLALLPWTAASSPFPVEERPAMPDGSIHANHIFNALHNSMKMLGSVLQHNGMSIFIATVPQGTEFYHGTSSPYRINGTEWLAFEPEHAMAFAHPRRIRRSGSSEAVNQPHDENKRSNTQNGPLNHEMGPFEQSGGSEIETGWWMRDHAHWEHESQPHAESRRHRKHKNNKMDMGAEDPKPFHHGLFNLQWSRLRSLLQYFVFEHGDSHRIQKVKGLDPQALQRTHHDHHKGTGSQRQSEASNQSPLGVDEHPAEEQTGYFHTYRTKRELRLIYFDGQSAAKSLKGTLDMQDIVLRNASHFDGSPAEGDNLRADDLCALARDQWDNRVDGFLRMVGGFEIILCSFAKDLNVVSILSTYPARKEDGGSGLSYARALATRFDGIGGDRVSINYDDFVTMFAYPDAMYFDGNGLPRVINDSARLEPVRAHIDRLVKQPDQTKDTFNWQNVVDMIITRYHYRINLMLSSAISTHHELRRELHLAIEPFINAHARNSTAEIERCANQFWVAGANMTSVPAQAVSHVSERLCSSLVAGAGAETYDQGIAIIEDLKRYLDWAIFRKCTCCELDEICQLPIWPSGSREDFIQPQCGIGRAHGAGGYWDMMGKIRQQ